MKSLQFARIGSGLVIGMLLQACGSLPRLDAVPPALTERAAVAGIPNARYWLDRDLGPFIQDAIQDTKRESEALADAGKPVDPLPPANLLAISGGGTEGAVINHIGLKVRNLSATLAKLESAHIPIVSRTPPQAMVLAPDAIRVELTEDPAISGATINHHIHFYAPDVSAMQKWYATTFGAIPGKRGKFEADDLPGVNLTFTPFADAQVPTKGRALDLQRTGVPTRRSLQRRQYPSR